MIITKFKEKFIHRTDIGNEYFEGNYNEMISIISDVISYKNVNSLEDELLSLLIVERIIKISTDFYVNAKTGRIKTNVNRLEARTDSISKILNRRTYSATEDARMLLNINPADINAPVYSEISQRDKMVLTAIYEELMKNLEVSKASLIQETPTIQIVDSPVFPLERDEIKWYAGLLMGIIYSMIIFLAVFLIKDEAGF